MLAGLDEELESDPPWPARPQIAYRPEPPAADVDDEGLAPPDAGTAITWVETEETPAGVEPVSQVRERITARY